jgi:BolA protein
MSETPVPTAAAIESCLREALMPVQLEVIDESAAHAGHSGANGLGFGTHFRVRIGGPVFAGKSRVAQHRLVYDALQKFTDAGLHALAIEIRA